MQCNGFMLSYRGYTIWIRTTGCVSPSSTAWSAEYQLGLNKVALHQYIEAAGQHGTERAAAAAAVRLAKTEIDGRMEGGTSSGLAAPAERVSPAWLMRLAESRQRKA